MSSVLTEATTGAASTSGVVVNDFSLQVATANGSGSQTANSVLMRSIFQMGVPVSGKNLFPSNIAGLPTGSRSGRAGTAIGRARSTSWCVHESRDAEEDVRGARRRLRRLREKLGLENPGKKRDDITHYPCRSPSPSSRSRAPEHAKPASIVNILRHAVADLMGIDPAESRAIGSSSRGRRRPSIFVPRP